MRTLNIGIKIFISLFYCSNRSQSLYCKKNFIMKLLIFHLFITIETFLQIFFLTQLSSFISLECLLFDNHFFLITCKLALYNNLRFIFKSFILYLLNDLIKVYYQVKFLIKRIIKFLFFRKSIKNRLI